MVDGARNAAIWVTRCFSFQWKIARNENGYMVAKVNGVFIFISYARILQECHDLFEMINGRSSPIKGHFRN